MSESIISEELFFCLCLDILQLGGPLLYSKLFEELFC